MTEIREQPSESGTDVTGISEIDKRVRALEEQAQKKKPKDFWDKLQSMSSLSSVTCIIYAISLHYTF